MDDMEQVARWTAVMLHERATLNRALAQYHRARNLALDKTQVYQQRRANLAKAPHVSRPRNVLVARRDAAGKPGTHEPMTNRTPEPDPVLLYQNLKRKRQAVDAMRRGDRKAYRRLRSGPDDLRPPEGVKSVFGKYGTIEKVKGRGINYQDVQIIKSGRHGMDDKPIILQARSVR